MNQPRIKLIENLKSQVENIRVNLAPYYPKDAAIQLMQIIEELLDALLKNKI